MGRASRDGWRRRALAIALAVGFVAGGAAHAGAVTDGEIATAQKQLDAARRAAKDAALSYLRAEHELAHIEAELEQIEAELPVLRAKVAAAHETFDDNAVALYTGSLGGADVASGLFGATGAMDVGRVTTLASSSTRSASDSLDEVRAAQEELEKKEAEVRAQRRRQQAIYDEMKHQSAVMADAWRTAGKELRKLQAEKSVQDYFAAVARQEAARKAAEALQPPGDATPPSAPGRRSGPADPDLAATVPVEDLLCPVQAPVTFFNDWGQPRSNWRVHEGTDVFAARGAPNVAVADGTIIKRLGGLGGNAIRLVADDGHMYYYAHFDHFEGTFDASGERKVKQGDVIGYTGNSGNAAGGPTHTHFEVHPGGGAPVNPFPFLKEMCAAQLGDDDQGSTPPSTVAP